MLEPIQIFFVLLLILHLIRCINRCHCKEEERRRSNPTNKEGDLLVTGLPYPAKAGLAMTKKHLSIFSYFILGLLYGLVVSVKLNGAVLGFVLIILLTAEMHYLRHQKKMFISFFHKSLVFIFAALFVIGSVYLIHFALARKPLEGRYYEASGQYKRVISYQLLDIRYLPMMLKEHIQFIFHYEKGVPQYDACKVGENGSLPVTWPFMDKGINYRWESMGGKVKYLYLQGNPVIWGIGLLGLFFSVNLTVSYIFFGTRIKNRRLFFFIICFLMLYVLYMGVIAGISRVMYLYHYFIPLLLSLFLFFLLFLYFFEEGWKKKKIITVITVIIIITVIIFTYFFFSPLTYYQSLTGPQFELRNWFPFWGLKKVQ